MSSRYGLRLYHWMRSHRYPIVLAVLIIVGMYLRFWDAEHTIAIGWDQARDAWKVRDLLTGVFVLDGPRTGVGHVYLGPLWYYYLAPFYAITRLDPTGAILGNMIVNLFNFLALAFVSKRIWGDRLSLIAVLFFAVNGYLIDVTKTPWNVAPVFGVSTLIFYCIHEIVLHSRYRMMYPLALLTGLFVHLHFAVVFLPPIISLSLLLARDKRRVIRYGLWSLPLMGIFIIPLVLLDIQWKGDNTGWFKNFLSNYIITGFHFRFFLIRIHDAFIQFERVLAIPHALTWGKFVVPVLFAILTLRTRRSALIRNLLMGLWFIVPAVVYSFYSGTTSEYYVLLNAPIVIFVAIIFINSLMQLKGLPRFIKIVVLAMLLLAYSLHTSAGHWIKRKEGGLAQLKKDTRACVMRSGCVKEFNIGFMDSYLYSTWTDPRYKNWPH